MSRSPSTHWVAGNPPHSKRVELKVAVALSLMSDERGGAGGGEGGGVQAPALEPSSWHAASASHLLL
eukprot:scaffold39905_cov80-Phaeocystis_antarctica.AAC.5